MDTLEMVKDKLNISDGEYKKYEEDVNHIKEVLKSESITFEQNFEIGFYSHVLSFISRLMNNEKVNEISEQVASQVSEKAIIIVKKMFNPIFHKYNVEIDNSEIVLAAIHIQLALENMQ